MLQASLGIELDPLVNEIRFRKPSLPPFLDQIILRELGFDGAKIDVELRRRTGHASVRVLRSTGKVHVAIIFD
jgi:hypothetical protein